MTANFKIVLYQPEIPANTGNIGRLCVGANAELHIIKPMRFFINDKYLKRAGLDYWSKLKLTLHENWDSFLQLHFQDTIYYCETIGNKYYTDVKYQPGNCFVFGSETIGIPESILTTYEQNVIKIPITKDVRSINIANSVAIVLYEALRQVEWR